MTQMFLSYLDENDKKIEGFFEVTDPNENGFIVFRTSKNLVHIPLNRVLKMKQEISNKEDEINGNRM